MTMETRYEAAMVLSGVGDAIGYKNGDWEFCRLGEKIHEEARKLGGIAKLKPKLPQWPVSDDTVLHLATAKSLTQKTSDGDKDKVPLYQHMAGIYKEAMRDMKGRAPGLTTMDAVHKLKPAREKGYCIPFNAKGGGCGAAMRSMCIGLRYPRPENLQDLIEVSIESGRMTHHHPTGYLGALTSALFTSYAIQGKPLNLWGVGLMDTLPKAKKYIKDQGDYVKQNEETWDYFSRTWNEYLQQKCLLEGMSGAEFPDSSGVRERDRFYKSVSFSGCGGASGHDAPMIAYDALLNSQDDWIELCSRSMLHGGDSDSTGVIAACCYGAMYGYKNVPESHYSKLEYRDKLRDVGLNLYRLAKPV